jgi:hypothetical protein
MPAFLTYSGVENYYKLMEEIDTIGFFLGDLHTPIKLTT